MAVSTESATRVAVPSPNFDAKPVESAIFKRSNPWLEVLQQRAKPFTANSYISYPPRGKGQNLTTLGHIADNNSGRSYTYIPGNKPLKANKRDLPENNVYFCDTCDRGFRSSDLYEEHVAEHEACRVPGCKYIAAPKLVQLHYNLHHVTGLAKKIQESAEDVEKWLAERRRNFPTAENIARKRQEEQLRHERGDVLENKRFGKMRGGRGRGGRNNHRWSHGANPYIQPIAQNHNRSMTDSYQDPLSCVLGDSPAQHPTFQASLRACPQPAPTQHAYLKKTVTAAFGSAALGGIAANYAETSSEEEGEIRDDDQQTALTLPNAPLITDTRNSSQILGASPNKTPSVQTRCIKNPLARQCGPVHGRFGGTKKHQSRLPHNRYNRKSTLLEKLLANEIRHERNVLLQCVKYVVAHNFFGAGTIAPTNKDTAKHCNDDDDDEWS